MSFKSLIQRLEPFTASIAAALVVLPLWIACGDPLCAVGAAAFALLSFACTKALLGRMDGLNQHKLLLEQQLSRVEKLSAVDELSAGIAHEINNPLAIISQEAQWLQHLLKADSFKDIKEIEECRDCLREIALQVDLCKETVNKLLSLARELEPVLQAVNLNDLVGNIAALVERETKARNIEIRKILYADMPVVHTDAPLIRQVLLNLLANAADAVDKDGVITISSGIANGFVEVVVEDSGRGIPEEHLGKVFTPFFTTKPQGKGTGLGLAICRGIVERLGGYLSVSSEVGRCTSFTVHLPLNRPREGDQ